MGIQETIEKYNDAWLEPDQAKCAELLEATWAEDGVLVDVNTETRGRAALLEYILEFHKAMPDFESTLTSPVEEAGGRGRFSWEVTVPGKGLIAAATDFVELAPDGKIQRLTVFIDRMGEGAPK